MQRIIRFSSLFILALALTSAAAAQTTSGSIAGNINDPNKAAITSQAYVICNDVDYGGVKRKVLSFTAVIQFQP